jgi:tetratricopeptide (TPR) repeat protein
MLRARAALADNRSDLALLAIGVVRPGEPDEAELSIVLGRAQAMAGQHDEALASFARAAGLLGEGELVPEVDALAMARLSLQAGRLPLALRALYGHADGAERPQTRAALRVLEGHILQALGPGSLEQAIAAYREALRAVPEHASALLGLALALHRQGAREAALAIAKRVRDPAQVDQSLLENALPRGERSARAALWRESISDVSAARTAWHEAMQEAGPWREHARATLLAFDAREGRSAAKASPASKP